MTVDYARLGTYLSNALFAVSMSYFFAVHTQTKMPIPFAPVGSAHGLPQTYCHKIHRLGTATHMLQAPEDGCINIRNMLSIK